MCTLSWTTTRSGYELFFNRDERTNRGPEEPPRAERLDGVGYLAPRDGDARGSWIAANEHGVTVCLLNGYFASRGGPSDAPRSRGLLVLDLAARPSVAAVQRELEARDLAPYEPFVLCAFEPDRSPRDGVVASTAEWDGLELRLRALGADDLPVCSSGHDAALARRLRGAEWERMRALGPMTPERLAEFHRSHLDGPGPASPCMHRDDAQTRSLVRVAVDAREVRMSHAPGSPCTTPLGAPLALARLSVPAH